MHNCNHVFKDDNCHCGVTRSVYLTGVRIYDNMEYYWINIDDALNTPRFFGEKINIYEST